MKQIIFLSIISTFLPCFVKNEEVWTPRSTNVSITSRILGGEAADIRFFGYQLSLRINGGYVCSASRITDVDILTAAHCITHTDGMMWPYVDMKVHGGTSLSSEDGNVYTFKRINVHPGWTGTEESACVHDIAHVKLNEKMALSEYENFAIFPGHDVVSFSSGFVSGWGITDLRNRAIAPILQYLKMTILRYEDCQTFMASHYILHPEQLCAFQEKGRGCCEGDSGAPLVFDYVIIGLHSSVRRGYAGAGGEPEIFTNVFAEQNFIAYAMLLQ